MHIKIPPKSSASCFSKRAFFFVWPPPQIHRVSDSWEASCCSCFLTDFFLPDLKLNHRYFCLNPNKNDGNLGKADIPRSPSFFRKTPKAGASACEKGGRWLLSLELLREAKVDGRWWGFLEVSKMAGFFLMHQIRKNWWLYLHVYYIYYITFIMYIWYHICIMVNQFVFFYFLFLLNVILDVSLKLPFFWILNWIGSPTSTWCGELCC